MLWYGASLGLMLTGLLAGATGMGLIPGIVTRDPSTITAFAPLLSIITFTQPLNATVFAADGVLQGAKDFWYQAKAMLLSVGVATASFCVLSAGQVPPSPQ